ncbi:MAG: GGDEF domain-containing protein [Acidimicrobiales bacterium]
MDVPPSVTLRDVWGHVQDVERRLGELEAKVHDLEEAGSEFRKALTRLGDALGATHDRPAMLSAVLDTCALYLRASGAVFYGVVAGTSRLKPLVSCGNAAPPDELAGLDVGQGLAGAAAERDKVVIWPGSHDVELAEAEGAHASALAVPVHSGTHPFGVIALYGRSVDRPFSLEEVEALVTIMRHVETAIENSFLYEEAKRLSITDGLTSLWNRRQFDLQLAGEVQRGQRFGEPFSVVLLDLDQMKGVNDGMGHQSGDALLVDVARRLSAGVREVDLVARYGGDEFGLILPNTGLAGALRLAEKVRAAVGDEHFDLGSGEPVRVTVSVGVASYPEHGDDGRALVKASDKALYRAKAGGGNRVEHAKVGT